MDLPERDQSIPWPSLSVKVQTGFGLAEKISNSTVIIKTPPSFDLTQIGTLSATNRSTPELVKNWFH
jgi:hypothetical protein